MAAPSFSDIIEVLPQLLFITQILLNLVLSWFFGSIAFRGMKKRMPFYIRIPAMLATGFVCLLAGASLRSYMFFFSGTIFSMLQIDLFIAGVIAAVIFALAFYMLTRRHAKEDESRNAAKLKEKIRLLESILVKEKVQTLKEEEVKKTAETLVPGFAASEAKLRDTDWEILLKKGDKNAIVVIGAYTGEVKKIEKAGAKDPFMLIGIIIIVSMIAFSVLTFRSLPSFAEGVASLLGMNEDQFQALVGSKNVPEGCVPTVRILMKQGGGVLSSENSYKDENVMNMVENETGRRVVLMYKTDYEGKEYVMSITLPKEMSASNVTDDDIMKNAEICSSTPDTLCDCIKVPELSKMTTGFIVAVRNQ